MKSEAFGKRTKVDIVVWNFFLSMPLDSVHTPHPHCYVVTVSSAAFLN